jgi:hypothetical protein
MRAKREIMLRALMLVVATVSVAHSQVDGKASQFAGTWRGDSFCVARNTACHDEAVVYRVQQVPASDNASISADKIVNGKAIHMGSLEFQYDQPSQSWVCQYPQGVWRLKVAGAKLNGTLTQPDGTLFRKIALRKDP